MHNTRSKSSFATALALVAAAWVISVGLADAALAQPAGGGRPPPPPAEALAACQSLTSGQPCSFSAAQGAVAGSCWAPPGKALACRPKDAPPPPGNAASGARR